MSISFCVIVRASLGLEAVVVIWNRLSCCDTILMFCARPATRSATSRSLDTVFARSVPRTTFSRFTAETRVWRIVSTSFCVDWAGASIVVGRMFCICTKTRALDSYLLGICDTNSQPITHTAHATASASQRRFQIACSAMRASS
jgi:hypothetical protein